MDSALTTIGLPIALAIIMFGLGLDLTTAELEPGVKDRISHRGKALRAIAPTVADLLRS